MTKDLEPDVIFMDVNMPKCNGIEATMLIHDMFPDIIIIILTASEEEEEIVQAIKYGATGYLMKTFNGKDFFSILDKIEKGEKAIFPRVEQMKAVDKEASKKKRFKL